MQTSVRVEQTVYAEAKKVFSSFGLTFGDAVNIFLAKVSMEKAIPFDLSLASEELLERKNNLEQGNNTLVFDTANQLFEDLGI